MTETKSSIVSERAPAKELHLEQLKLQPAESLPCLGLLAFFKRAVPRGALAHLLDEVQLNKTLTRLERNKLVTRKESADAYTRYLNDPLAINLYGLHPVICENEFFTTLPNKETLYKTAAKKCGERAYIALGVNSFAYALELYDCAEKLYEHLAKELNREDLLNNYAAMLINKGIALRNLTRLAEALAEYNKALLIYERLVHQEQQTHLANELARAYMNKGNALWNLTRLAEALAEYDKAIAIRERLVHQEQQTHVANELARTYINKALALWSLTRLAGALAEYDKAMVIYERLVHQEQQTHLANDLALAYMNKAIALEEQSDFDEALACYEKSQLGWTFCVEHLNMFWVMPSLLKTLRYRLMTLLQLQFWPTAVGEIMRFRALFTNYIEREGIDEGLKETARTEMVEMISTLRKLSPEQRELLYAELGADGESVRSLIDKA